VANPLLYELELNLPAFRLYLFCNGELRHDYPVAIGKPGTPTPTGNFRIVAKQHHPTWYPEGKKPVPPGPSNPLGQWWLGLNASGYGIHGCLEESSIGKPVSKGCIRMHNRDVADLVRYAGVGTPVRIVYNLFALRNDAEAGQLWLWIGEDVYRRCLFPGDPLKFLWAAAPADWDEAATGALVAKPTSGWQEIPRLVEVYCREKKAGRGYSLRGQIWFTRPEAGLLPGGTTLGVEGGDVSLEELASLTVETVDWRYSAVARTVTALPARLRRGDEVREGAVRLVLGRVFVAWETLAGLLGEEPVATGQVVTSEAGQGWRRLDEIEIREGHLRWCPATWEVLVEEGRSPRTGANRAAVSPIPFPNAVRPAPGARGRKPGTR